MVNQNPIQYIIQKLSPSKRDFILFALFLLGVVFYLMISSASPAKKNIPSAIPRLISTYPTVQGEQIFPFTDDAVSFTFDQEISLTNLQVQATPSSRFKPSLSEDSKTLILVPESLWKYDTKYQILVSGLGAEDIHFSFTPLKPDYSKPMGIPAEQLGAP
jgi:hypothetical protein